MMTEDYYFNIIWQDGLEKTHNVGILARINNFYYLLGRKLEKDEGNLFFRGIPPFYDFKLHKSKDLFPFFKMKVLANGGDNKEDLCKLLEERLGKNHIDSYSVEKIEDEELQEQLRHLIYSVKKRGEITPVQPQEIGRVE